MKFVERTMMIACFPFATTMRMLGVLVMEGIELWEEVRGREVVEELHH